MTNEEIKKLPEGTKVKVYIPEHDREIWRGARYIEGELSFQKIGSDVIKKMAELRDVEWYAMSNEEQEFYEEWADEKTFGVSYLQPFTKRFNQFTLKKGTECVCYQYDANKYSINEN